MSVPPIVLGAPGEAPEGRRGAWSAPHRLSGPAGLSGLTALAVAVTALLRVETGLGEPLWLDETWTGLHALRPTLGAFLEGIQTDINAPLYYVVVRGWSVLAGVSDAALRAPSLALALLVPFLALAPSGATDRTTRLVWCALLATWAPGILQAQEARCYALLLGLCTLGTLLHLRLLAAPSLARAAAWAGVGALAVLTHYHAVVLFGFQGLAYLARHRGRALATWPAALLYLPAFAWLGHHAPQLAAFSRVSWYTLLAPADLPTVLLATVGATPLVLALLSVGLGRFPPKWMPVRRKEARQGRGSEAGSIAARSGTAPSGADFAADAGGRGALAWGVGAAAAGALVLVVSGMVRPSFTLRYLTPFVPGLLLGLAAWAARIGRVRPWAPHAVAAYALVWVLLWVAGLGEAGTRRPFNFATAAGYLMAQGVDAVAFTWDNPSARPLEPSMMAELGSFFFRRAGAPIAVTGVPLAEGEDPSRALAAAARGDRPGLLWIYDLAVPGTAARAAPPTIEALDPRWACRDFGHGPIGVLACVRSGGEQPRR